MRHSAHYHHIYTGGYTLHHFHNTNEGIYTYTKFHSEKKGKKNMSKLKLITTENFGELQCNFYRNMNDDILLTREQIGTALEYANPSKVIQKIHLKHKDRLDSLSVRIKSSTTTDLLVVGNLMTETVYYTERGIMELCRWSRQPLANQFMDWVWDIVEKYRKNLIQENHMNNEMIPNMTGLIATLESEILGIKNELNQITKVS